MTTLEDAIKTVEKSMPDFKILGCRENKTFYFFTLQPRRLLGTDETASGGSAYVVWKDSGKFDMICFDLWDDEKVDRLIFDDEPIEIDLKKRAS